MHVRDWPITRKLAGMLLLVSTCAVLLTSAGFVISEVVRLRQAMRNNLATLAQIIAANSTAALAFASEADAREILAALKAEPQIVAAALYDRDGRLFARYPASLAAAGLPPAPGADEFRIEAGYLAGFAPVGTEGSPRLGTLYLRAELSEVPRALVRLGVIATAVVAASVLATYLLSRPLQRAFSQPVLALAGTAKGVAEHQDYSVRVPRVANDELGTLVDAFNHMLGRIQEQDAALKASKEELQRHAGRLEERVAARTRDLEDRNRELRSSEAYAVLIVEAAHDAFIAMDEEGRVAGWNHRAEETFGWTREEVLRRPLAELIIPEELRDAHRRGLERFLQTAEGKLVNRLIELTALRRDGRSFPAELTIAPLRRDGRWVFTAFVRDISERKEAEESLRRQAAELAAANEELDAFAYSVSHDLRAPLRSIDGFSQMLLEDYPDQLDDAGRDALRRVRAASQRMGMLIDDLLNLARVTRAEMNRGRVDLSAMAAGVAEELRREAPERTVEVTVAPGLTAWGDPALLRVALENLLRNCWKYTRHQPHPRVEVLAVPGDGQRTFVVRDNGAGFDMRYADKLFGAFQRLHAASEFEGTGIGLATVRRILARHGGRVWAEGTVGQGASFYFTL